MRRDPFSNRIAAGALLVLLAMLVSCGEDQGPEDVEVFDPGVVRVPGDAPTIQAGIDTASAGQTVLVAPGVYSGEGNRDIRFRGRNVRLIAEAGPERTILQIGGDELEAHRGFIFRSADRAVLVEGFTVRGAYAPDGAALHCEGASPTIRDCVFEANRAGVSGGAIRCKGSSPWLIGCTIVDNGSPSGGAVFLMANSSPTFERCIIAFSGEGEAVKVLDSSCHPTFMCTNIYGNAGGDWEAGISDQQHAPGNRSADPLFCDPDAHDFRLRPDSPCLVAQGSCQGRIGALGACED